VEENQKMPKATEERTKNAINDKNLLSSCLFFLPACEAHQTCRSCAKRRRDCRSRATLKHIILAFFLNHRRTKTHNATETTPSYGNRIRQRTQNDTTTRPKRQRQRTQWKMTTSNNAKPIRHRQTTQPHATTQPKRHSQITLTETTTSKR